MSIDYDQVRQLIADDYNDNGDDEGEPMVIGGVTITAVAHLADGSTKSVFLHDGGLDECLGLLIRHSDILREITNDE
jgi:hypothetical protein